MTDTYSVGILMSLEDGREVIARANKNLPTDAVAALDAFIACSRAGVYDIVVPRPDKRNAGQPHRADRKLLVWVRLQRQVRPAGNIRPVGGLVRGV